ncbi:hypothetical protein KIL84_012974 [Mauremys mutica]|uniref:Uncharacterized protein n=1 Tax=Mauremys mutica TaxID=74926 RepID=A0A9D3XTF6_9SAUR|nr:hypothetical protein KIL84_012974 [Mauremys mutica]
MYMLGVRCCAAPLRAQHQTCSPKGGEAVVAFVPSQSWAVVGAAGGPVSCSQSQEPKLQQSCRLQHYTGNCLETGARAIPHNTSLCTPTTPGVLRGLEMSSAVPVPGKATPGWLQCFYSDAALLPSVKGLRRPFFVLRACGELAEERERQREA